MKNDKLRKNFIWNFFGTFIFTLTSLLFMMTATRINGIDEAGVFSFAFSFACMTQVIALYQGRTYQVTDRSGKTTDFDYIFFRIITCSIMIIFGLIFTLLRQYDLNKTLIVLILVLYKCIDAFSESYYGIFQKNNNLYQAGVSYMLKGIFTITCFIIVDFLTHDLLLSSIFILIADLAIIAIYDYPKYKKYHILKNKTSLNVIKYFIITGFAIFIVCFLTQYLVNTQKYIIDFIGTDTDQAILGILIMPATIISLCAQLIINPFLYDINKLLKEKQYPKFKNLIIKISLWLIILGVIVLLFAYFFGIPLMQILFSVKLENYLSSLMLILLGSLFFGLVCIISNSMIALRKTTSQAIFYLISSLFSTIVSLFLVSIFGVTGAAISFCTTNFLLLLLFSIYFIWWYLKVTKRKALTN